MLVSLALNSGNICDVVTSSRWFFLVAAPVECHLRGFNRKARVYVVASAAAVAVAIVDMSIIHPSVLSVHFTTLRRIRRRHGYDLVRRIRRYNEQFVLVSLCESHPWQWRNDGKRYCFPCRLPHSRWGG